MDSSGPSSSRLLAFGVKAGVSWSSSAPSLPASSSGRTASSVALATASSIRGSSITRPREVVRALSRRSGGSDSRGAECRESSRWSLTSKTKSFGVTVTQRATVLTSGTA